MLSDDDLVSYLVAARDTGQDAEAKRAAGILVFRRLRPLRAMVSTRIDNDQDIEDVVSLVMENTIRATFDGFHAGQFFSMMKTIMNRRIADFYARKSRELKTKERRDDSVDPLDQVADGGDQIGEAIEMDALERVLDGYSGRDRMVIEMKIDGMAARGVAEAVAVAGLEDADGMSAQNVDQIYSRFKKRHLDELFPRDFAQAVDDQRDAARFGLIDQPDGGEGQS